IKGYAYRTIDDIKETFKKSGNKVNWINDFIGELHTTFSNMKKMESSADQYLQRLRQLKIPVFVYPFFIKGYKFFGDDEAKLSKLFHIMEILVFRFYLMSSRADIIARLNEILIGFNGNIETLRTALKNKLNETYYWGDYRTKNTLDEWMYENPVLNYLLWRYEAGIQNKGYVVGSMKLENEQIEHISPQVPPNGEPIASGYEVDANNQYTDDFKRDYLNSLGNLMLISGSHNASIGNKPFREKLNSYNKNPLLNQQGEIKNFASGTPDTPVWDSVAIDKRHETIRDFAVRTWSFDNI
ncbi:MAG: HNH endonuclease, partial [Sphingobacteriales bacterium]